MGVVTAIAVIMFILIRSGKLGFMGDAFRRQMMRFTARRTFLKVLIISLCLSLYLGWGLYLMERGEFYYAEQRDLIGAIYIYQLVTEERIGWQDSIMEVIAEDEYPQPESLMEVGTWGTNEMIEYATYWLNDIDFALSVTAHETNQIYGGWVSHFNTVFFVEHIETIGLWFLYKRWYHRKEDIVPYGGFTKDIKKIAYRKAGAPDSITALQISTKYVLVSVVIAVIVTIFVYILTGASLPTLLFTCLIVVAIAIMVYPRSNLSAKHKRQFRNFRMFLIAMITIALILIFT